MQEQSRYVVGIDVGTKTVRCVVGHFDATGVPKIVGVGSAPNTGMRKGVVSHLTGPAAAIDAALEEAERMSGHQVDAAAVNINGAHITSMKADGMIAITSQDGEVTDDDILRLEEVATTGKVSPNREVLTIVPHAYRLDGQDGIKDPLGMTGTRLELKANIVSCMAQHSANLRKSAEMAKVEITHMTPSVLAGARAVLMESQLEHGVAVIDMGAATTGVAVFEEGDLQYVSVVPMGGQNVTNDLAIGLKTDPEVAEIVKTIHARFGGEAIEMVEVKHNKQKYSFSQAEIDEIVEARYEEIFELVAKELKKAGGLSRLPSGVVLIGGAAKVKGIVEFAKEKIGVAAKIGTVEDCTTVSDEVKQPDFVVAMGLMLQDALEHPNTQQSSDARKSPSVLGKTTGFVGKLLAKFK